MTSSKNYSLLELSKLLNTKLIGDGNAIVDNLKTIQDANANSLTFVSNQKYSKYLTTSKALAFIVHPNTINGNEIGNYLVTEDPYLAYAKASSLFSPHQLKQNIGSVHPTATVSPETKLGQNVVIGSNVFIGPNCSIGDFSSRPALFFFTDKKYVSDHMSENKFSRLRNIDKISNCEIEKQSWKALPAWPFIILL